MTSQGFDRLIEFLEGAFRQTLTKGQRDAYWLTLQNDADELILKAAVGYVRGDRARYGFPKPGDLLEHQNVEEMVITAWGQLLGACTDSYISVEFEDLALSATIEALGGREHLNQQILYASEVDFRFLRKDFERMYPAMRRRGAVGPKKLTGLIEQQNAGKWPEKVPEPVLIGAGERPLPPLELTEGDLEPNPE